MTKIYDFGEEKRVRRRYAVLDALFTEAHAALHRLWFSAEGAFIVLKSPGADGQPYYQFIQEGISGEELAEILRRIGLPLTLPE